MNSSEEENDEFDDNEEGLSNQIYDILEYLKSVPNYAPISFTELMNKTNIDLEIHTSLKEALANNVKIKITSSNQISYEPEYNFKSLAQFLSVLENSDSVKGITTEEIIEACQDVQLAEDIMNKTIISGLAIAMKIGRSKTDKVFFPRCKKYLVQLTGDFSLLPQKKYLFPSSTSAEKKEKGVAQDKLNLARIKNIKIEEQKKKLQVYNELRRGDVVYLGHDFLKNCKLNHFQRASKLARRVSLANTNTGADTQDEKIQEENLISNLMHNKSPFSCSALDSESKNGLEEEHKETKFSLEFKSPKVGDEEENEIKLPLDPYLSDIKIDREYKLKLFRIGCTNDIRNLWRKVSEETCFKSENKPSLIRELLKEGLINENDIKLNNKQAILKARQKRKRKRRNRRPIKISNTHMV